jgi:hypothetical protein
MMHLRLRARHAVIRLERAGFPATANYLDFWVKDRGPSFGYVLRGMKIGIVVLSVLIAAEISTILWLR